MPKEPPIAHAPVSWDPTTRRLEYLYNGRKIVSMTIPGEGEVKYRIASDGQIQSSPMYQQIYIALIGDPVTVPVTITMSADAVPMRPHRARAEQAVLGQVGRPTIDGVNGMYDILDDLLLSWHGRPWRWIDPEIRTNADGTHSATFEVTLDPNPWAINIKPQYYRKHLGYEYHRPWEQRPNTKPVAGWCSWEAYRRDVNADNIAAAADFLAGAFADYGLEYLQIDDGFQMNRGLMHTDDTLVNAWLSPNEKFPSGYAALCNRIRKRGLIPGIWLSVDIWDNKESQPPDFVLRDADGKPLKPFWMHCPIDCLPETIERYVKPLYRAVRETGFGYVKTDQLRHLLYDALHEMVRERLLSNDEAEQRFRNYVRAAREGLGREVYYLASWGVLTQTVGIVDACRIATDANPKWPKIRMQLSESARWFHTQRILFLNDPDHICARTKPEWARTLCSLVSLSGQLLMLSDAIEFYDEQRIEIIRKCLPTLTTTTAETGPLDDHYPAFAWTKEHGAAFKGVIETEWAEVGEHEAYITAGEHDTMDDDHPLASLWAFHLNGAVGKWCVALRVATLPLRESRLSLWDLGLDPERTYAAFDFWSQRYLGRVSQAIDVPALDLGNCQAIALREVLNHPQYLASSRHVSMGAIGVAKQEWDGDTLTLAIEGIPSTTDMYWIQHAENLGLASVEVDGAAITIVESAAELDALSVSFAMRAATIRLRYQQV